MKFAIVLFLSCLFVVSVVTEGVDGSDVTINPSTSTFDYQPSMLQFCMGIALFATVIYMSRSAVDYLMTMNMVVPPRNSRARESETNENLLAGQQYVLAIEKDVLKGEHWSAAINYKFAAQYYRYGGDPENASKARALADYYLEDD